ncbi:hypothetical protein PENFLA_c013G08350 [Penicillium flavigenum]|uniref:Methyltransferase domain-containing protein n=1 Tax=Penicillium flavigenum TaxID=254877 RepID=A0A1V6T912_9EURO|nr:hypothetical protein PENFLA_c013G08350 [Penicillium flavigenum]
MAITTALDEKVQSLRERYILPHNVEEIERMQNQHEWVKGCADGLIKAPLDMTRKDLRVLDAATADGYWIQDAKSIMPAGTEFVGFDIAPDLFPPTQTLGPKVTLSVQNLIEPFSPAWKNAFDLVHERFVISLFKEDEIAQVLHNLLSCVKPGGWVQFVEPDFGTCVSRPKDKTSAFQMIHQLTGHVMADNMASTKLAGRLEDAGWVNIGVSVRDMMAGNAHPDPALGERGRKNMLAILNYFQSVTSPETFGLSEKEWLTLPERFSQDMDQHETAIRHYIVWAQKPVV